MNTKKYFIFFIVLLISLLSVVAAVDVDDSTPDMTATQSVIQDNSNTLDNNMISTNDNNNNINKNNLKNQKTDTFTTSYDESNTETEDKSELDNNLDDVIDVQDSSTGNEKTIDKLLTEKSFNKKTDGEVTVVKEWQVSGGFYDENNNWEYVEFTETFATLYSNGTLIVDVNEHVLYPNGPWGGTGDYYVLAEHPWRWFNQIAAEYTIKDIIINERYPTIPTEIAGGGLLGVGYDNSNETYPNLMNVNTYTVNFYVQDPDFSYDPQFIDYIPFKHVIVNNLVGGTGNNYGPKIFGMWMGVSPNIETLTFNNFEYTNTKGLWIENVPEVNFINSKITLKSNMTIKNSTVNFINSELNIEYKTDDETYTPTDYAIDTDSNLNIENSIITIKNLKEIKLGSNNNLTGNTIITDSENTIEIHGSNNTVTGNTLTAAQKTGDNSVIVVEGENNVIDNPTKTETKITIVAPDEINVNEEVAVTIIFKDVDDNLLANDYISITVGDGDPEPVITDENGEYVYMLTPTETGTLLFTVDVDESNRHYENSTTKEFTVIEAKTYFFKLDTTEFTIGSNATITATIYIGTESSQDVATNISKGKVTFKVNGKTLKDASGKVIYAKVVNGVATIENYEIPQDWAKNGTTIQAVYSGSADLEKMSTDKESISITVPEPTITTEDVQATAGSTVTLKATIAAATPVNNGKVVFKINGKTVKDSNGKVIYAKVTNGQVNVTYDIPADMKAKDYVLTATFISSDYKGLEDTKILTVTA